VGFSLNSVFFPFPWMKQFIWNCCFKFSFSTASSKMSLVVVQLLDKQRCFKISSIFLSICLIDCVGRFKKQTQFFSGFIGWRFRQRVCHVFIRRAAVQALRYQVNIIFRKQNNSKAKPLVEIEKEDGLSYHRDLISM
jgi:hypothetical protein